jgi:group II intron reverse transcriptase/maturase
MAPRPVRLLSKSRLHAAWQESRDSSPNAGRPGVDNVTALGFAANLDHRLTVLARNLRAGLYGPSPLRAVFIPKPNSDKERLICIPTIADRLVQRTIAAYLSEKKKLPIYNSSSFGFLRDLGTKAAIDAAVRYRRSHDWCLKTDIESFFDRIPRQYLKERLSKALRGHSLVPIISKVIDCEVKITQWNRPQIQKHGIQMGVGVRQGMPLSPILANLVLSEFDSKVARRGLKMVRYADDIAIFFETKQKAQEGHKIVSDALAAIKLTIPGLVANSKTQIIGPSDPIDFLGWEIARVGVDNEVVSQVAKKQIRKIARKLEDEYTLQKLIRAESTFQETIVEISNSISGYLVVYKNAYNFVSIDSQLRSASRKIIGDIFVELFGENALANVTPEEKRFLGMSHVAFDDLTSDLDY